MDLDRMLTEAAPARHLPPGGPDSPAAVRLYRQITARPPGAARPSRRRRYAVPALIGAAAVAAAVALALAPASPARHGGHGGLALAAWSVVREPHGLVKVTIRDLRDPAGLQAKLRAAGVPANVRFVHRVPMPATSALPKGCLAPRLPGEAIDKLGEKIMPSKYAEPGGMTVTFLPAAIPHGIGMYLKVLVPKQPAPGFGMEFQLVQATPGCTGPMP